MAQLQSVYFTDDKLFQRGTEMPHNQHFLLFFKSPNHRNQFLSVIEGLWLQKNG